MTQAHITPGALRGAVYVPPSKSDAHRAILCAALAAGMSAIRPVALSDDIAATIDAVRALGAEAIVQGDTLTIDGTHTFSVPAASIDCRESGSTLRFLIPLAAAGGVTARFTGRGRLPERPIGVYGDCLPAHGARCDTGGGLPLTVSGRMRPGRYDLPGDVSSQFITGLLLALPLLDGDSEIALTTPLGSAGYVAMTLHAMAVFGIDVKETTQGWRIPGGQRYVPGAYTVESDWSQAAFFLASGALGSRLTLRGLSSDTAQGDAAALELFRRFGAVTSPGADGAIHISPGTLTACDIDATHIPDLVPILAATAAVARGTTRITGAARLRLKESDRLAATASMINALGGQCEVTSDGLVIRGVRRLTGGQVDGANDHRIVMAAAILASCAADGDVEISDAHAVNKSYPNFFDDIRRLGGHIREARN